MKTSPEIYTIRIRCKKYVQRYLMRNFGTPCKGHSHLVDIRKDAELKDFITRALRQPVMRHDKLLSKFEGKKRNCEVELRISRDQFERYGWELSQTDELHFNSILETRCKKDLLQFLRMQYILNETIDCAIDEFYHKFGFSDSSWPKTSIQKIWTRNKAKLNLFSLKEEFNELFTTIFMEKLSIENDNFAHSNNSSENLCIN